MIPDAQARAKALNPRESFIVQAPAGSGKTELLTQRFLSLLAHTDKDPEEILAITFTNKAVNEMQLRITEALERAKDVRPPASAHEKQTWDLARAALARNNALGWQLLENPGRLRISTIDAFCSRLTRQLPIMSGFGASGSICDDPTPHYKHAISQLLADLEKETPWSDALSTLFMHLDNNIIILERLLIELLARRDQWLPHLMQEPDAAAMKAALENSLANVVSESLSTVETAFPKHLAPLLIEMLAHANRYSEEITATNAILNNAICETTLPGSSPDDLPVWQGIAALLTTKQNTWRASITKAIGFPSAFKDKAEKTHAKIMKEKLNELIEQLGKQDGLLELLCSVKALPPTEYNPAQWGILQSLITILPVLIALLRLRFGEQGVMDYVENVSGALAALGDCDAPSDLALRLDYTINHILIDEFQDTSIGQFRLLERLTLGWTPHDNHTLFIVGDPMQSIYRFREAEVGLFLRAKHEGIGEIPLTPLTLKANFRSKGNIIGWINDTFSEAFPKIENISQGAILYSAATPMQENAIDAGVEVHGFIEGTKALEANRIKNIVEKAASPSDVSILVRTKNHLRSILPVLRDANIPYLAIDIESLAAKPVIFDLLALTKAMLDLSDRTAWLAILRAPWCGLSLADLHTLACDTTKTLWHACQSTTISAEGQTRLNYFTAVLTSAFHKRGRVPLARWVFETWEHLNGPSCHTGSNNAACADTFFALLDDMAVASDIPDFDVLETQIIKKFANPVGSGPAVQVMTIHKSKGLEFDTVILPSLESRPRSQSKALLAWTELTKTHRGSDLLLAPIRGVGEPDDKIYEFIQVHESKKETFEIARLLYVACTRAKRKLHLLASVKRSNNNEITPSEKSLLYPIWKTVKKQFVHEPTPEVNEGTTHEHTLLRLADTAFTAGLTFAQTQDKPNPISSLSEAYTNKLYRYIGTVTHACLENITRHGVAWWHEKATLFIKASLTQLKLNSKEQANAIDTINTAITNTLNCKAGQWILQAREQSFAEYRLCTGKNDRFKEYAIDRFFIEDDVAWIIDYKTIAGPINSINVEQYYPQLEQYKTLLQSQVTQSIRLGLYFPLQSHWHAFCILQKAF